MSGYDWRLARAGLLLAALTLASCSSGFERQGDDPNSPGGDAGDAGGTSDGATPSDGAVPDGGIPGDGPVVCPMKEVQCQPGTRKFCILDQNGCESCDCVPEACPEIGQACPSGSRPDCSGRDPQGCPVCSCVAVPDGGPGDVPVACGAVACPAGTRSVCSGNDVNGCPICKCEPVECPPQPDCPPNSIPECRNGPDGCTICACREECPPVACKPGCVTGTRPGERCPACICQPPECKPVPACPPNSNRVCSLDQNGCSVCTCEPVKCPPIAPCPPGSPGSCYQGPDGCTYCSCGNICPDNPVCRRGETPVCNYNSKDGCNYCQCKVCPQPPACSKGQYLECYDRPGDCPACSCVKVPCPPPPTTCGPGTRLVCNTNPTTECKECYCQPASCPVVTRPTCAKNETLTCEVDRRGCESCACTPIKEEKGTFEGVWITADFGGFGYFAQMSESNISCDAIFGGRDVADLVWPLGREPTWVSPPFDKGMRMAWISFEGVKRGPGSFGVNGFRYQYEVARLVADKPDVMRKAITRCFGPQCGPVCGIFCPNGNKLDEFGCPLCECLPAPCQPLNCEELSCPGGFNVSSTGCQECKCKPGTPTCKIQTLRSLKLEGCTNLSNNGDYVARTPTEWNDVYKKVCAGKNPPPSVNFDTEMVVGILRAGNGCAGDAYITEILFCDGKEYTAKVASYFDGPCSTQIIARDFVAIPKGTAPIKFTSGP